MTKTLKQLSNRFLKDESGQAATEYVMLISMLVGIVFAVGLSFRASIERLFSSKIGDELLGRLFDPNRLHRFRMRKF